MSFRLFVVGGTGSVGRAVCRRAVQLGAEVTSLSRREPPEPLRRLPWASRVTWLQGDSLEPDTYRDALAASDGVVHTVGTLLENTAYKAMLGKDLDPSAPVAPLVGLARGFAGLVAPGAAAAASSCGGGRSRTVTADRGAEAEEREGRGGRGRGEASGPEVSSGGPHQVDYDEVNRDTAAMVSIEAAGMDDRVRPFVFISAASAPPLVDPRYLSSKREAEVIIEELRPELRPIIFRPGLIYTEENPATVALAGMVSLATTVARDPGMSALMGALGATAREGTFEGAERPLRVETVADAALQAIADPACSGVQTVDDITNLAQQCRALPVGGESEEEAAAAGEPPKGPHTRSPLAQ